MSARRVLREVGIIAVAAGAPAVLTLALYGRTALGRDLIFLYLGIVAVLGVAWGLWPALAAAVASFLFLDYYFSPPIGTWTIADERDVVSLLVFLATAVVIGMLTDRRRRSQLSAERLAGQLRRLNAELVRLNKEQADAAQAALRLALSEQQVRTLRESERLRRELLANVSHELRTPLGTILTASSDARGQDSLSGARGRLSTIEAEARRLNMLVDDMLDMAQIEGGGLDLDLEPVRLADAFAAAAERLRRASPAREVRWDEPDAAVDVLADWGRLGQVLDNLLANADRFGAPGTPVELDAAREEDGLVTVRVRDHGPGVAPELRDRIFDRFVHSDTEVRDGGATTGLGLAIVRGLVEAHAGSVALEDTEGGASFRFTLPLAEQAEPT